MRFVVAQLLLATVSFFTHAQWTRVHPSSPIQRYIAHAFVTPSNRWVTIGNDIASSENNGTSWTLNSAASLPIYFRPGQKYTDVNFLNEQTGFIASEKSIYKTVDGGAHWQQVVSLLANHSKYVYSAYFNAITFVDENNGWAVGEFKKIFRTTNGGDQWEEISWSSSTSPYIAYTDVHFINASTGFIAGYEVSDILMNFGFEEFILRTDDGGQHWERQVLPTDFDFRVIDVHFHDEHLGYVHLRRTQSIEEVYVTTDGGQNWIDRTPPNLRSIQALEMLPDGRGFAFGQTHDYRLSFVRTIDHGETWEMVAMPIFDQQDEFAIIDITFANNTDGFAVGAGGNILVTTDGGVTWNSSNAGYPTFMSFDFVTDDVGYASSGKGFFKTLDGGKHWQYQPQSDSLTIFDMKFEDEARGAFFGWRNFYYSIKEHGTSASRLQLPVNFISLSSFLQTGDSLFASGMALSPRRNFLLRSGNGGDDWLTTEVPNATGLIIQMERKGNYFYYSDGVSVFRSSTSGTSWKALGSFTGDYINGIIILDDESILASFQSGKVKHYDGDVWIDKTDFAPGVATDFIAKDNWIFAYGTTVQNGVTYGAIWRSTDSGEHWVQEDLPVIDFGIRDMDIEGNTAFATGGYGQIFSLDLSGRVTSNEVELLSDDLLDVYPVPVNDHLFLKYAGGEIISAELLTTTGARVNVKTESITQSQWKLDVSGISSGIYVVRVNTMRGWQWKRMTKE